MTTGVLQNEISERSASSQRLTSWHSFRTVGPNFPLETDQYNNRFCLPQKNSSKKAGLTLLTPRGGQDNPPNGFSIITFAGRMISKRNYG